MQSTKWIYGSIVAISTCAATMGAAYAVDPAYFTKYESLKITRDGNSVLLVEMNSHGGPFKFSAHDHEVFVDAFYDIGRDRENKVVILTGAGGDWMGDIDFESFGNVADPDVWGKIHDDGEQLLENLANIRVPVICAVEGKAWIHTEWCLLANVIIAGEGATFNDLPHFKAGIIPGDGLYPLWSYYAGPGRAQAMLLSPEPLPAATVKEWGVVSEVVPRGQAVTRAKALASTWLSKPDLSLRYVRVHFIQPVKQRLLGEASHGLALEGATAAAVVKNTQAQKSH